MATSERDYNIFGLESVLNRFKRSSKGTGRKVKESNPYIRILDLSTVEENHPGATGIKNGHGNRLRLSHPLLYIQSPYKSSVRHFTITAFGSDSGSSVFS